MRENPGVAQGSDVVLNLASGGGEGGRERAHTTVEQRTRRERIRLDDCKNVIELMDEVKQGKLRATLAALEAGYFGGAGRQGQVGFAAFSLFLFAAAALLAVIMPTQELFGSGFFLISPSAACFMARTWYLRQLEQHLATSGQGGAAGSARTGKAGLLAAKTTDRLAQGAQRSLCTGISGAAVVYAWAVVFYGISGGDIGADPILPSDPSTAFFVCGLAGATTTACAFVRLTWLLGGMRMKEAQFWVARALLPLAPRVRSCPRSTPTRSDGPSSPASALCASSRLAS
jgi:hypothetical protein